MGIKIINESSLKSIADAIRTKGGTSSTLEFPNDFVNAIESISTDDENNFVITIIMDENEMYAPDCSYDEIINAYDAGKNICVVGYQEIFDLNNDGVAGFFDEDTQSLVYTVTHNISELNSQRKETLHYTLTADGLTVDPNEDIYYDAEDANALPNDVANGKIFYNSNGRAVGTHTNTSGPVSVPAKEVNFRDYDGTVVYSYTPAEFVALSAMPANPDHSGDAIPLTSQGWNWSFADAKAYVAKYGRLEVGQMYATADGKTHILIHLDEGRTSPILGCCPNGTVDVDWGDGTAHDTLTGTSVTAVKWTGTHNYAEPGDYDIKLSCTGKMGFYGNNSTNQYSGLLRYASGADARNYVYRNAVQVVFCADSVTSIGSNAFSYCYGLSNITIPDSVTSIGNSVFTSCSRLSSVTIPDSVTSIGGNLFQYCYGLSSITIPDSVTSIGTYAFHSCYVLSSITIPDNVTSIGESYTFSACYDLSIITIPDSVTSIGSSVFASCRGLSIITIPYSVTSIGSNAFSSCYNLSIITIPDSVTSIGNSAFSSCYGLAEIHFLPATPPSVSNSSALNIPTDCKIYVPTGSLSAYTSATNYPSSSTYTYIEE